MFLSTQSVSRPKRDSIYSFLRHFGPFGSITTAIFSENPGCSNLAKTRFLKKEYSHASTDHQVQFSIVSSIFQRPWHTQGLWKIAKKPNPVVKFGCGSVRKFAYFFQKPCFCQIGTTWVFTKYLCCNASQWPQMHQKWINTIPFGSGHTLGT